MRDFIQITKDDVLPRLLNGEEVYAFTLTVYKNGNITPTCNRLSSEKLEVISKKINDPNVVLFVKKEASEND